jgi:hypothetical protein
VADNLLGRIRLSASQGGPTHRGPDFGAKQDGIDGRPQRFHGELGLRDMFGRSGLG